MTNWRTLVKDSSIRYASNATKDLIESIDQTYLQVDGSR